MSEQNFDAGAIANALLKLDPDNDDHWTGEGLPSMDALKAILHSEVKRADVMAVDPDFTRDRARQAKEASGDAGEAVLGGGAQPPDAPKAEAAAPAAMKFDDALKALEAAQADFDKAADKLKVAQANLEAARDADPRERRRASFVDSMRHLRRRQDEERARIAAAMLEAQKNAPPQGGSALDRMLASQRRPMPPHPSQAGNVKAQK